MILLSGHSLTAAEKFRPETMSLNLEERKSTASMQLGPEAPEIGMGSWLLDEEEPGAGIVWRVKTVETNYHTKTRTVQLEHVVNTLKDLIMFGEITPEDMGGSGGVCTARQAAAYILGRQSIWTLGDFAYSVSNPYSFNGENLFAALETVTGSLEDAVWEYDLSSMPFKLHIRHMSDEVASEMREGRNIQSLRYTVDRSRMFTRFYPIGRDNLHINGDYVSKNEGIYGTVAKVETDQSLDTEGKLRAWANERLSRHCEPAVTVTISGLDYSAVTGETLDRLVIGKKCRIPLPEYGTTIVETIKKLSWGDKIKEKTRVTVTLANVLEDVASIISRETAKSAGGGRGGAANAEKDHAWFVDTTEKVGMVAEAVAGSIDGHPNWSRVSELMVDGNGIDARVTRAEGDIVTHAARITVTETEIDQEVIDRSNADSQLSGRITVEAGKISQIVSAVGRNGEVTAASIVLAINNGSSGAYISADHVLISGTTSINQVFTVLGNAVGVSVPLVCSSDLTINSNGDLNVYDINLAGGSPITLNATAMAKAIKKAEVEGTGANMTLKLTAFDGSEVNFTKAAATSLTESWSSGKITVTAQPGGIKLERILSQGATTWDGNTAIIPINALWNNGQNTESTGWNVRVNAVARYNAGYDSAHLSGVWGSGSNSNLFTVTKVQSGSSNSLTCRVTAGINYNTSTHKYTAVAYGNQASKATAESGTEAYEAGYSAGSSAGYSSGYAAGVIAGTAAGIAQGYKSGWNDCIDNATAKQLAWTTYWTQPNSASARTCWWYSTYLNSESVLYLLPAKKT